MSPGSSVSAVTPRSTCSHKSGSHHVPACALLRLSDTAFSPLDGFILLLKDTATHT